MMPVKLTVTSNAAQRNEQSPANKRFLLPSLCCRRRNHNKKCLSLITIVRATNW